MGMGIHGKAGKASALGDSINLRESERLAARGAEKGLHVGASDAEAAAGDAGDDVEACFPPTNPLVADRRQLADTRHLVASRAVVLRHLGLDHRHRSGGVGAKEVG